MKKTILASTSPRRKQLLEITGIPFEIVPSTYEEDMTINMPPEDLAAYLSYGKARDVASTYTDHIIIAADTFIVHKKQIIGKPHTKERAIKTLESISDAEISIVTGITVINTTRAEEMSQSITTTAKVADLSQKEILDYVATGEPLDCAGAFNIFGKGRFIIERIDGDHTNIMGLPMRSLEALLKKYDIIFKNDPETWLRKELSTERSQLLQ